MSFKDLVEFFKVLSIPLWALIAVGLVFIFYHFYLKLKNDELTLYDLVKLALFSLITLLACYLTFLYINSPPKGTILIGVNKFEGYNSDEEYFSNHFHQEVYTALKNTVDDSSVKIFGKDIDDDYDRWGDRYHILITGKVLIERKNDTLVYVKFTPLISNKKPFHGLIRLPNNIGLDLEEVLAINDYSTIGLLPVYIDMVSKVTSLGLAIAYIYQGDFNKAYAYLNNVEITSKSSPHTKYLYAICSSELGLYEQAKSTYLDIIEYYPDYVDAYIGLSNTLSQLNEWDEALSMITKAARLAKSDERISLTLGLALSNTGQIQKSIAVFDSLLKINSISRSVKCAALINLARIKILQAQSLPNNKEVIHEAKEALDKAEKIAITNKEKSATFSNKGIILAFYEANYSMGLWYMKAADQYHPSLSFDNLLNMGFVYIQKNDLKAAEEWFTSILEKPIVQQNDNNKAKLLYNLACLFAEQKKYDQCYDILEQNVNLWINNIIMLDKSYYEYACSDQSFSKIRKTERFAKIFPNCK